MTADFKGPGLSHSASGQELERIRLTKRGGTALELVTQQNVAQTPSCNNSRNTCV